MTPWIIFTVLIFFLLGLELFVFHAKSREVSIKEAACWSVFWIFLSLMFALYIYFTRGPADSLTFLTGYLIEKSLSIDNLFVFLVIFKYFHTPTQVMHKVLFWGILGAMLMRLLFIMLGIALISRFHAIVYLLGLFLIYTGIRLWMEKEKEIHPEKNIVLKLFYRFFPVTTKYSGDRFFVKEAGRTVATPLFVTLLTIETVDVIFALDSIPAILAITYDPFIVYTSNIFAILGLRSLYFVLSHMMTLFHYLHYGLALILIFVGCKMLLGDVLPISTLFSLGFIFLTLTVSVLISLFKN